MQLQQHINAFTLLIIDDILDLGHRWHRRHRDKHMLLNRRETVKAGTRAVKESEASIYTHLSLPHRPLFLISVISVMVRARIRATSKV